MTHAEGFVTTEDGSFNPTSLYLHRCEDRKLEKRPAEETTRSSICAHATGSLRTILRDEHVDGNRHGYSYSTYPDYEELVFFEEHAPPTQTSSV